MSYWDVQNGSHLESTAQRGEAMHTFLLARFKDLDLGNVTIGLEIGILTTPTFREGDIFTPLPNSQCLSSVEAKKVLERVWLRQTRL